MSATTPKTIELSGFCLQHEAPAAAAITPGMLVERNAGNVRAHAGAGLAAMPAFAVEYDLTGKGIDDAYSAGENVLFKVFTPGSHVFGWLASGENAAQGALLASNGDGRLAVAAAGDNVVGRALEAVNATAAAARVKVEIFTAYISAI